MDDTNRNPYTASASEPKLTQNAGLGLCTIAALVVGIANVGAVGTILTLMDTPTGAAIRPMGHTMAAAMFALLGLVVGVPLSVAAIWTSRGAKRAIGVCLLIASFAPLPLSSFALHMLAEFCGFTLKP
jgi:hypothetical protein